MSYFDPWDGQPKGGAKDARMLGKILEADTQARRDAYNALLDNAKLAAKPQLRIKDPALQRCLDTLPTGNPDA